MKRNAKYKKEKIIARVVRSTKITKFQYLPMTGAKRHELPISGKPFGPGTSEYGLSEGSFGLQRKRIYHIIHQISTSHSHIPCLSSDDLEKAAGKRMTLTLLDPSSSVFQWFPPQARLVAHSLPSSSDFV